MAKEYHKHESAYPKVKVVKMENEKQVLLEDRSN
jgi:hypothetical protein